MVFFQLLENYEEFWLKIWEEKILKNNKFIDIIVPKRYWRDQAVMKGWKLYKKEFNNGFQLWIETLIR